MDFKIYAEKDIAGITRKRSGEIRLGEKVKTLSVKNNTNLKDQLSDSPGRYVLIGLPEDIGVRANFGRGGTYSAWHPALSTILNVQSNNFLVGDELLVLGYVDFSREMESFKDHDFSDPSQIKEAREVVARMDDFISPIIKEIVEAGKEPIIIGGGHNNAYPNLKGAAEGLKASGKINEAKINCINCDAHCDLRPLEGRHSGNGFSYAIADGFLDKYAMLGLHEMFNTGPVLEAIQKDPKMHASFFEDIFIRENVNFKQAVRDAVTFTSGNYCGLELDIDAIQNIPASAKTSSGISTIQARQFVTEVAGNATLAYFHLAEAAPVLSHIKTDLKTGKLLAYLVTDYIKARNSWYSQNS
jgi:formiminoglutamase